MFTGKRKKKELKCKLRVFGALEGLIIVTGLRRVSEGLANVAVGPLIGRVAVICGVRHGVRALGLSGTVLCVVEVEAVANVAE